MGAYSNLGDFCTNQEVSGDAYSEFMIDMDAVKNKIGVGQHSPFLCIRMNQAKDANTSDTLSIELRCSAAETGGSLTGATTKTVMMPLAGLANAGGNVNEVDGTDDRLAKAGAWIFRGQLPYGVNLRYVQLWFNNNVASGHFHIDAWLSDGPPSDFRQSQKIKSDVGNP